MEGTSLPKRIKTPTLIAVSSFLLCLLTNAYAKSVKNTTSENSSTILQNSEESCKKNSSEKSKRNDVLEDLDHQEVYQFQQAERGHCSFISTQENQTKDVSSEAVLNQAITQPIEPIDDDKNSEIVLDAYEKIEELYAYDPIGQAWVQIKAFKIMRRPFDVQRIDSTIEGNPYINFWAYDLSNQTWHKVSLISYLQQANTQINSDSPAIATKQSILPDHNNQLNDNGVAKDELLEELLGVHTFPKPANPTQEESIWANFSFDFTIGAGAVSYTNRLEQMRLLQRQKHDYFFITQTNEVYKPNWFHDTLNKMANFDPLDHVEHGGSENATFQGKGLGVPITLGIQYVCWQQLLVGVGREIVFNTTSRLVHNDDDIAHKAYMMHKKWFAQGRWFAKFGWYLYSNAKHRFFGDIRLFYVHHLGRMFPRLVTFGSYLHEALAYNLGIGYEQQLTDYLSCTARLSMEQQTFKQFSHKESYGYNIHYKQPAIYLQVGLSMRCAKHDSSKYLKYKAYQDKIHKFNGVSKLEGLQDLLGLD